tara:strand:+ start:1073 stop:1801 length:729 start_codon:yes stop_codon:yes gene_type:complete
MKFNTSDIQFSNVDKKKGLILSEEPSERLAEFIGILSGDGYMNFYPPYFSIIEIAGDSRLDQNYLLNYVSEKIRLLFNLKPKIRVRKDQNCMYLRLMSKALVEYLEMVGFKKGKKEQIGIPLWILLNDQYMKSFIKGVADTDFSLVLLNRNQKKYRYYPRVSLASKSKRLIFGIHGWLDQQGIKGNAQYDYWQKDSRGTLCNINQLHINGRRNLELWMKLISFRNERHLNKYKKYKNGKRGI